VDTSALRVAFAVIAILIGIISALTVAVVCIATRQGVSATFLSAGGAFAAMVTLTLALENSIKSRKPTEMARSSVQGTQPAISSGLYFREPESSLVLWVDEEGRPQSSHAVASVSPLKLVNVSRRALACLVNG
jgi:hypothetical protein